MLKMKQYSINIIFVDCLWSRLTLAILFTTIYRINKFYINSIYSRGITSHLA